MTIRISKGVSPTLQQGHRDASGTNVTDWILSGNQKFRNEGVRSLILSCCLQLNFAFKRLRRCNEIASLGKHVTDFGRQWNRTRTNVGRNLKHCNLTVVGCNRLFRTGNGHFRQGRGWRGVVLQVNVYLEVITNQIRIENICCEDVIPSRSTFLSVDYHSRAG